MKNLFQVVVLLVAFAASAEIIPSTRRTIWEGNVGIPGGIPTRTTVYSNFTAGASVAAIQAALNSCTSNQAVTLAAGSFTNNAGYRIPTGVTLRGAGMGSTYVVTTGGYSGDSEGSMGIAFGTSMFGSRSGGAPGGTIYTISSGATNGSTNLVLSTTPTQGVGDLMAIDELNNTSFVTLVGQYGISTASGRSSGARAAGQIVEILSKSGGSLTFAPALAYTFTNTPEAVIYSPQVQWAGVESLTMQGYSNGVVSMIGICSSKYIWVKDVEIDFADRDHGRLGSSFRCEIRGGNFHDSYVHGSGSYDNPIMLHEKTSGVLIQDNIFRRTHTPIMLNSGAFGNVIAYNYLADPYDYAYVGTSVTNLQMYEINMNHRAHPWFNLVEGNVTGQIRPDRSWGSSSHGTLLRNYVTGTAYLYTPYDARGATNNGHWAKQALRGISIDSGQFYYNIIGNLLVPLNTPSSGVTYLAVYPDSVTYNDKLYLLNFGQSDVGGGALSDGTCYSNAIVHGNYDTVNVGQMWDGGIADHAIPSSYFLTTKPTEFGNLAWPPFDPANSSTAVKERIPAGYRYTYGTNPPTSGDSTAPTVAITSPTSSATYATSSATIDLSGTSSDNVSVSSVAWSNDRGGSGACTGTTSWSKTSISLSSGVNVLTITATDSSSNTGTDTLTVTYTPTSPGGGTTQVTNLRLGR